VLIPKNIKLLDAAKTRAARLGGSLREVPARSEGRHEGPLDVAWAGQPTAELHERRATTRIAGGVVSGQALGQPRPGTASIKTPTSAAQPWAYTLTVDGFIVPEGTVITYPYATPDPRFSTGYKAPMSARAVAVTRPASTMIARLAFLYILSGRRPVARLSGVISHQPVSEPQRCGAKELWDYSSIADYLLGRKRRRATTAIQEE